MEKNRMFVVMNEVGKIEKFASKSLTVRPWKTLSSFSDVETSKDFAKL